MKKLDALSEALTRVREIAKTNGGNILRSRQMLRADREFLVRTKWLQEIIKGWYLLVKPDLASGDSSAWYANFWDFLRIYLQYHFKDRHCLSAEDSLDLHTGSTIIPKQVIVITTKGGGSPQSLPFGTSIFIYSDPNNIPKEKTTIRGLQVMTLPYALCKVSPVYFQKNAKDAEIALQMIRSSAELTQVILQYNFKLAASRLIGAYRFLGNQQMAENMQDDLIQSGWNIKEENPFVYLAPHFSMQSQSPYTARIYALWQQYRKKVVSYGPEGDIEPFARFIAEESNRLASRFRE